MYEIQKKLQISTVTKRQHEDNNIIQRSVQPVTDFLNSKQSNILIQLERDKFIPNTKKPHLHIHHGGITYKGTKNGHHVLVRGDKIRYNVINDVLLELQQLVAENNPNAQSIIDYINNKIL